jgi:hypothetical protein
VYFSPLLFATMLGVFLAWIITRILNWFDLARFVWYPPLFFLALTIICTSLVGRFIITF